MAAPPRRAGAAPPRRHRRPRPLQKKTRCHPAEAAELLGTRESSLLRARQGVGVQRWAAAARRISHSGDSSGNLGSEAHTEMDHLLVPLTLGATCDVECLVTASQHGGFAGFQGFERVRPRRVLTRARGQPGWGAQAPGGSLSESLSRSLAVMIAGTASHVVET